MNTEITKKPVDLSRRRLAKGGLAVPIVLATLASKHALAVPYQCTLSGKLSNNTSTHGPKTTETCHLGQSAGDWSNALIGDTRTFNAVFGVDLYYFKNTNPPKIGNSNTPAPITPATLLQVLTISQEPSQITRKPVELPFAKMAVVLYMNAPVSGDIYPLIKQQVIEMFNCVINNSNYNYTTSSGLLHWTPTDIKSYFSELYF